MPEHSAARSRRRQRLTLATLLVVALAGGASWWYLEHGRWREITDNAYLKGNLISIAAKVPGQVVSLSHEEGDRVSAGETLLLLAPGDAERALEEAKHTLGFAVREVLTRKAAVATAEAELHLRRTTTHLAQQEFERRRSLIGNRTVSQEEVDAAQTRAEETLAELAIAERKLDAAKLQAGTGPLRDHPMIQVASARLREAVRTLNKHRIISPVSGRVAQRYAQIGQVIDAGTPLYAILEADNQWVEANFKENQLVHLRPGQPVTAKADLYGDEHAFRGTVTNLGAGTGAEFSLLPPQNATGNWIKIVQRVPVRIDLNAADLQHYPLPLGSSLTVEVDTHDRDRPRTASASDLGPVSAAAQFEDLDAGAEALIQQLIGAYAQDLIEG